MLWHRSFAVLLRLCLTGAFVPVLLYSLTVFPALATASPGLPAAMVTSVAGPPLAAFSGLTALAWISLRLWRNDRWRWTGFALGFFAFGAVWTAALL